MQQKVTRIAESLSSRMTAWKGVAAVVLGETATVEPIDPCYNVDLVVCHDAGLPSASERSAALGGPEPLSLVPDRTTDLFLIEGLPVRVMFRARDRIDGLLERVSRGQWAFRDETTNILQRLASGRVLRDRDGWLAKAREKLAAVPDAFWDHLKLGSRAALERAVTDMGAAVYNGDHLFYQLSAARVLQSLCSFLFALNRQFEPSHHLLLERTLKLATLPAEFAGRFDSLIRPDVEITPKRRHELSQIVAKSISLL